MDFSLEHIFEELSQTIGGTCVYSLHDLEHKALEDTLYNLYHRKIEELSLAKAEELRETYPDLQDKITDYLAEAEQELCEVCGWWNYPGETGCCEDEEG